MVIVGRRHCVGFAGNRLLAIEALRSIAADATIDEARSLLATASSQEARFPVSFLSASLQPCELVKIEAGSISSPEDFAWIGDLDAFDAFQERRHSSVLPLDDNRPEFLRAAAIGSTLERVAGTNEVASVGELVFMAQGVVDAFSYIGAASIAVSHIEFPDTAGEWADVRADIGPEVGSFSVQSMTPKEPGVGAMAVFLAEGRFGSVLWPQVLDEPRLIRANSRGAFSQAVHEQCGLLLSWPFDLEVCSS